MGYVMGGGNDDAPEHAVFGVEELAVEIEGVA